MLAVAPSQVAVNSNDENSSSRVVTCNSRKSGQAPPVVYITLYDVPKRPPVISPELWSITAPSPGSPPTKLKVPPESPSMLAVAPSQVAVNSNKGLSLAKVVTGNSVTDGHAPPVVYITLYTVS